MQDQKEIAKPLDYDEVRERRHMAAEGKEKDATIALLDISLKGVKRTEVIQEKGRLRVLATTKGRGMKRKRPYGRIPSISLSENEIDLEQVDQELDGYRPSGVPTIFGPNQAKPTHQLPPRDEEGLDRGATIFDTDDRYLFNDTSFPWRCTGKVNTVGAWGSGTTIGRRLVLTASHVVNWTGGSSGGIAGLTFTPAYFDGSGPWGTFSAERVIYWNQAGGSLSDFETAFDYVVLVMSEPVGSTVGYPGYRAYDDDWHGGSYWETIGYPSERASGERPAYQGGCVISSQGSHSTSGQTGYVLGHFNDITPGQSGGPVWGWWGSEPWPRVVGVTSTIGSTAVESPSGTTIGDNEYGGGPALSALISWARSNYP